VKKVRVKSGTNKILIALMRIFSDLDLADTLGCLFLTLLAPLEFLLFG
jgi:hypothetical protein